MKHTLQAISKHLDATSSTKLSISPTFIPFNPSLLTTTSWRAKLITGLYLSMKGLIRMLNRSRLVMGVTPRVSNFVRMAECVKYKLSAERKTTRSTTKRTAAWSEGKSVNRWRRLSPVLTLQIDRVVRKVYCN